MNKFEDIGRELERRGKSDKIRQLAESPDGQRLSSIIDAKAVETAAKSGDSAALSGILSKVLSTDEGRRLAENIRKMMQE